MSIRRGQNFSNSRAGGAPARLTAFRKKVLDYWKKSGRHDLPWRKTKDPYRILVSEIMLQQTQVPRVRGKYKEFLKKFPTVRELAEAPLFAVLTTWSGLGYNRRAKYVHKTAKKILAEYKEGFPTLYEDLRALPGIGDYTAKAIRVYALNQPEVLIETNVRTVFLHHFFPGKQNVDDTKLLPLISASLDRKNPREWYSALMDYGTYLKEMHPNPSRRSKHHTTQSQFEGSLRQVRGAVLKILSKNPASEAQILRRCHLRISRERLSEALLSLERDRLIAKRVGRWGITET